MKYQFRKKNKSSRVLWFRMKIFNITVERPGGRRRRRQTIGRYINEDVGHAVRQCILSYIIWFHIPNPTFVPNAVIVWRWYFNINGPSTFSSLSVLLYRFIHKNFFIMMSLKTIFAHFDCKSVKLST